MEKIRIYCDGACSNNPGPGGWAGVLLFNKDKQVISGGEEETTNNRMELKAALESLLLATKMGYKKIDVYSDSSYVVNAIKNAWYKRWRLNNWMTKSGDKVKNKDLWVEIVKILDTKSGSEINFIKVKGHSGDVYNELVDKRARKEVDKIKNNLSCTSKVTKTKVQNKSMDDDWDD